jgi:predicted lipid-binding transport protein (Tim44 family)
MNGFVDITTIIFLVLAVVIFLRLRNVLGRRTGNERQPFDPYSRRERQPAEAADKVIRLPGATDRPAGAQASASNNEVAAKIETIAPAGTPLSEGLNAIARADATFDPQGFIAGGRQAYEMIVTAFAEGDRKTLKQLLAREVYDGFVAAIGEREQRQEVVTFNFIGIDKADIVDASLKGTTAQVKVRFVSSLVSATKNAAGDVVDGDPTHVGEVTDVWTFAREVTSRDPNWKLVATESVE